MSTPDSVPKKGSNMLSWIVCILRCRPAKLQLHYVTDVTLVGLEKYI